MTRVVFLLEFIFMLLKVQLYLILLTIATFSHSILRASLRQSFNSHHVLLLPKQLQAPINALNVIEYLTALSMRAIIPSLSHQMMTLHILLGVLLKTRPNFLLIIVVLQLEVRRELMRAR